MTNNYDGYMDKECIELCDTLNTLPGLKTFESCCGHLKDRYSIWFFCDNIDTLSRLGRAVDKNYSDGKWEIVVDSTDTRPRGVFWLRTLVPFASQDEMEQSLSGLIAIIKHWFKAEFDEHFAAPASMVSKKSLDEKICNLDEAAEEYANTHYGEFFEVEYEFGDPIETIVDDKPFVRDAFKSGAEWMAGQGYTTEKTVDRTPLNGPAGICLNLHDSTGLKIGDKVIVQVRKKR